MERKGQRKGGRERRKEGGRERHREREKEGGERETKERESKVFIDFSFEVYSHI